MSLLSHIATLLAKQAGKVIRQFLIAEQDVTPPVEIVPHTANGICWKDLDLYRETEGVRDVA